MAHGLSCTSAGPNPILFMSKKLRIDWVDTEIALNWSDQRGVEEEKWTPIQEMNKKP